MPPMLHFLIEKVESACDRLFIMKFCTFVDLRRFAVMMGLVALVLSSEGIMARVAPDYHTATATANYRPVDRPGMQRRVAQTDAEEKARKEIYEFVGSLRSSQGYSVNDLLARDARLKARVLEIIRNSETYDWTVNPACACVQVWVRLDVNQVRAALGQCGY